MRDFFKFAQFGTNAKTEVMAGITTFMTMAYIIFVNPAILSAAGVPLAGAATATAVTAGLMCILMGVCTNRPFALAAGMGFNAILAFTVIGFQQANVPWQVGMSAVFVEGVIILILVLTGLREAVMNAIPLNLKRAIGVGIGLFITMIGLAEGGLIRPAPITLVAVGDFSQPYVWVTLIGLLSIFVFMAMRWKCNILAGMVVAAIASLCLGIVKMPGGIVAPPDFSTFMAPFQMVDGSMAITRIMTPALGMAIFALMLTDFFDTMGTVVAVSEQAGFLDSEGKLKGIKGVLVVDSVAAATGGLFGGSSATAYIESAAGVADGGRTGLTAVVTGILFLGAAFFAPLISVIGGGFQIPNAEEYALLAASGFAVPNAGFFVYPVTAGALIVVGFLMMKVIRDVPWNDFEEAFPAFLTIIAIPLTYNISYGIGFGFISHVFIKLINGKWRSVHPLLYIVSAAFVLAFALPAIEKAMK